MQHRRGAEPFGTGGPSQWTERAAVAPTARAVPKTPTDAPQVTSGATVASAPARPRKQSVAHADQAPTAAGDVPATAACTPPGTFSAYIFEKIPAPCITITFLML